MDRVLSSRDRVNGLKSQPWQSFFVGASIQSVVCPVWSLFEVQHYCRINSQPWKKAVEIRSTCHCKRRYQWKNPCSTICGAKTWIWVQCLGAIKKISEIVSWHRREEKLSCKNRGELISWLLRMKNNFKVSLEYLLLFNLIGSRMLFAVLP